MRIRIANLNLVIMSRCLNEKRIVTKKACSGLKCSVMSREFDSKLEIFLNNLILILMFLGSIHLDSVPSMNVCKTGLVFMTVLNVTYSSQGWWTELGILLTDLGILLLTEIGTGMSLLTDLGMLLLSRYFMCLRYVLLTDLGILLLTDI